MDLAKIRQKARQEQEHHQPDASSFLKPENRASVPDSGVGMCESGTINQDVLQDIVTSDDFKQRPAVQPDYHATSAGHPALRDPLEVILAGRAAAGCDEDL